MTKQEFFKKALPAARAAGHPWPEYAVCEAALESAWGASKLARLANNLFGQKDGKEDYPNLVLPTWENKDLDHDGVVESDERVKLREVSWPIFPDWETCFRERVKLLQRVKVYRAALDAKTGEDFIRLVSKFWATDPKRADKVLLTYRFNINRIKEVS